MKNRGPRRRKPNRLQDYDYTRAGMYYVTICARNRECLFGEIIDDKMRLNGCGKIVHEEWERSAVIRREINLDAFITMPNHIHGIIFFMDDATESNVGAHGRAPLHRAPRSLGSFIAGFKSIVTKRVNELRRMPGIPVWQRNYYEHVVRDERDLNRIREYIVNNPAQWDTDEENITGRECNLCG